MKALSNGVSYDPVTQVGTSFNPNPNAYIRHGRAHVQDEKTYVPLTDDPTPALTKEINDILDSFANLGLIDKIEHKALLRSDETVRTQVLYFLRKIHKNPYGIRPIVSGCSGPTEGISAYVDSILQPIVCMTASFLKDSKAFIQAIESTPIAHHAILVSIDVSALYTSIPQQKGIIVCQEAVRDFYPDKPDLPNVISTFLEFILKANVFTFNGKPFKQKHGTAMGTKCAPCFANLFMNGLETKFLETRPLDKQPSMWKRYIDDIWCVWPHSREDLEIFLQDLNSFDRDLKFTWDISDTEANYLDVHLYKGQRFYSTPNEGLLDVETYFKPTNTFQYVHFTSAHPPGVKKAIPLGETHRYLRSTSDKEAFERKKRQLETRLEKRGYPVAFTRPLIERLPFDKRKDLLATQTGDSPHNTGQTSGPASSSSSSTTNDENDEPTPKKGRRQRGSKAPFVFPTTFCPWVGYEARKSIDSHWHLIEENPYLKEIFPEKPIMAFKRLSNLADKLVRARIPDETQPHKRTEFIVRRLVPSAMTTLTGLPALTAPCGDARCGACPMTTKKRVVSSYFSHKKYALPTGMEILTCRSKRIVYLLECPHCRKQYVGQTSLTLGLRMRSHRQHWREGKNKLLYNHLKRNGLALTDLSLTALEQLPAEANVKETRCALLRKEKVWIARLDTMFPKGFNTENKTLVLK